MRTARLRPSVHSASVLGLFIIVCTSMLGCGRIGGGAVEDVHIYYPDGTIYCEGARRVRRSGFLGLGKDVDQIGIWRFYFPDGSPMSEAEYDDEGNEKRSMLYAPEGEKIESWTENDDVTVLTAYQPGGQILFQERETAATDQEDDSEIVTSIFTWFGPDGTPTWVEETTYVDDVLEGPCRLMDNSGRLILQTHYRSGMLAVPERE